MDYKKVYPLFNHECLQKYSHYAYVEREDLIFANPNLRKYTEYNYYTESSFDYNLQPKILPPKESALNYGYLITDSLDVNMDGSIKRKELLSSGKFYINLNSLDTIFDRGLDYIPERIESVDEKDLFIKKKELIDEDNFIFDILKDDENKLLEFFESGDETVKMEREKSKDEPYHLAKLEFNRTEAYLKSQKKKWESSLSTAIEYYNESIVYPENKIIP